MSSPITLAPFVVGFTCGLLIWTFDTSSKWLLVLTVSSLLFSIGSFFTRLVLGDERVTEKIRIEIQKESEKRTKEKLDKLEQNLAAYDRDSVSRKTLHDLRSILETFKNNEQELKEIPALSDVSNKVNDLFNEGIRLLHGSVNLHELYQTIQDKDSRQSISKTLKENQKCVQDIVASLSKTVTKVLSIKSNQSSSEYAQIKQELEDDFEIAIKVSERIRNIGTKQVKEIEYA